MGQGVLREDHFALGKYHDTIVMGILGERVPRPPRTRGYLPVPVNVTVRGPVEPLLLIVSNPGRGPVAIGAKTTA